MDIGNRYVHFKLLELVNQLVILTRLLLAARRARRTKRDTGIERSTSGDWETSQTRECPWKQVGR